METSLGGSGRVGISQLFGWIANASAIIAARHWKRQCTALVVDIMISSSNH